LHNEEYFYALPWSSRLRPVADVHLLGAEVPMTLTRKQFLNSMFGVVAGAAGAALLVSCADDDDGGDPGPDANGGACTTSAASVNIGTNHGHALTVSAADVAAGNEKAYNIQGTSGHPHTVTVTAAMFTMLKNNTPVTVTSTTNGTPAHPHTVTITCA
jgi:hypothetical protein